MKLVAGMSGPPWLIMEVCPTAVSGSGSGVRWPPFDLQRAVRYMLLSMTRAATFFGYWFSYPLPRGGFFFSVTETTEKARQFPQPPSSGGFFVGRRTREP